MKRKRKEEEKLGLFYVLTSYGEIGLPAVTANY